MTGPRLKKTLQSNGKNRIAHAFCEFQYVNSVQFIILHVNSLMPTRYNCTYVLCLFLRSNCCKKLILTLLTHKSPKHTSMSIEINHFHY